MTDHASAARRWIRRFRPALPGAPAVVCLPHAGGSASFFVPLARALAPHHEVLAVQYPGRQDRGAERPLECVREIADGLLPLLRPSLTGPFVLFGHSMGATVAYELARRLEESGDPPAALVVSGRPAPSRQREGGVVHLGTDDELIGYLRGLEGTDDLFLADDAWLRLTLPALRADSRASETYRHRPGPRLTCPVRALIGAGDPVVTREEAAAWGGHTTGAFALEVHEGGHFSLREHWDAVAAAVTGRAPADAGTP